MLAATVHCCAQVNVAIMLAPVAFLGHITSQPVEAMARMETDKVSLDKSLLHKSVPTALVLNAGFQHAEETVLYGCCDTCYCSHGIHQADSSCTFTMTNILYIMHAATQSCYPQPATK